MAQTSYGRVGMSGGKDAMFLQRRCRIFGILMAGLLAMALSTGCGEDDGTSLPVDEVAAGWSHFENGEFDSAVSGFQSALGQAPGWSEPYSGLGWCYAAKDSLARAEENFEKAIDRNANHTDAWAGLAVVLLALQDFRESGSAAGIAVRLGRENYVFRYDSTVTARSLRIIMAECAFYVGDYATAEEQVELVDLTVTLEPTDPDYLEALLESIGRLSRH